MGSGTASSSVSRVKIFQAEPGVDASASENLTTLGCLFLNVLLNVMVVGVVKEAEYSRLSDDFPTLPRDSSQAERVTTLPPKATKPIAIRSSNDCSGLAHDGS